MKRVSIVIALSIISLIFNACEKVEGEGGSSTIKGKIIVKNYEINGAILQGTYPGSDEDVYIVYGEGNTFYNDRVRSSYDGTFEFKYLQNGKYTIFVYEEVLPEPANANKIREVIVLAEISKKKSIVDLGEINIIKK